MIQTRKIVVTTATGAMFVMGLAFAIHGLGQEGWQIATRWTARYALLPFVLVFAASELARYVRDPGQQLLRNRRGLGLSFAASHLIHAGAIVGLYVNLGKLPSVLTLVGGGLAYLFIVAMAVTSTDVARRVMGPGCSAPHCWWAQRASGWQGSYAAAPVPDASRFSRPDVSSCGSVSTVPSEW